MSDILWQYLIFVILLSVTGLYCIVATYNLIRLLIGLEITIKAVTLLLVVSGWFSGDRLLAQSMVITLIVVEVVVMVVAAGIVLSAYRHTRSIDTREFRRLKG